MINLQPNETIILAVHRHWITFAGKALFIFILIIIPFVILSFVNVYASTKYYVILAAFLSSLYYMLVFFAAFAFWMNYYLNMWIITTKRIVDIEQKSLFKREVSEFMISKVQDVTIEIPNFTATAFKFGNIIVQTAGESSFTMNGIAHPEKTKDVIIEYAEKAQKAQYNNF